MKPQRTVISRRLGEAREAWRFFLPLLLVVFAFIMVPVAGTFWESLLRDVPFLPQAFIGLANYQALFQDPVFYKSLRFTVLFVLVSVPLELALGLGIALVLNEKLRWRGLLRAAVLIPWAIPAAVSGRVFELIYHYSYGAANWLLHTLGITREPVNWLGSETAAFFALVAADAWKTTPFAAILLLAGLSAIPGDLYAQAMVDRAGIRQRFTRITLPLLKPVLIVALLFRTIEAFRIFDVIYVLTGGGPGGATLSLSLFGYRYFAAGDFGYGAAISVILFLLALGFSVVYVRAGGFRGELS